MCIYAYLNIYTYILIYVYLGPINSHFNFPWRWIKMQYGPWIFRQNISFIWNLLMWMVPVLEQIIFPQPLRQLSHGFVPTPSCSFWIQTTYSKCSAARPGIQGSCTLTDRAAAQWTCSAVRPARLVDIFCAAPVVALLHIFVIMTVSVWTSSSLDSWVIIGITREVHLDKQPSNQMQNVCLSVKFWTEVISFEPCDHYVDECIPF